MVTVDDLKEWFDVREDQDLGPIFGRKKGAVSVWRKNGVPANIERMAIQKRSEAKSVAPRPSGAFDIPKPTSKIPIISWAQAGPDGFFEDSFPAGAGFAEINRPFDVTDPNAYALIITGDSMMPKFEPGDVIVVSPNMGVRTGDYAVVRLKDGTVAAKRVREKNAHFILESVNPEFPPVECQKEDVVFTHRIVWVKQGG
jgi:phage repressor protein C with HTH and peptisase S24 domain